MVFPRKPRTGFKMLENPKEFIDKNSSFFVSGFHFPLPFNQFYKSGCWLLVAVENSQETCVLYCFISSVLITSNIHSPCCVWKWLVYLPIFVAMFRGRGELGFQSLRFQKGFLDNLFSDTPDVSYCCFCVYIYIINYIPSIPFISSYIPVVVGK